MIDFVGMARAVEFDSVVAVQFDGFAVHAARSQDQLDAHACDGAGLEQSHCILASEVVHHIRAVGTEAHGDRFAVI